MARTKFDKQVDESADTLARGAARVLAGRDLDGVRRTDATFWRAGTRVLPKVEGKVRRRSYKPGWRRLSFRLALGDGVAESGYLTTRDLDATRETLRELTELWENREAALAALEPAGIGAASVLTVGTATYMVLTRERRELMREWVRPLHDALHQPLGLAEQKKVRLLLPPGGTYGCPALSCRPEPRDVVSMTVDIKVIRASQMYRYYLPQTVVGDGHRPARTPLRQAQEQAGVPAGRGRAAAWPRLKLRRVRRSPRRSCGTCSASGAGTRTRTGSRPSGSPRVTPRRRRSRPALSVAG
ncbi:hypothetical protein [Streptomyces arboris]|uniref:hypothetical protein n=1 Tax=Streptomyces arboris TaxID=2600619 RepID=UPI00178C3639|nr:hypothetical protein [Streptomyces arboris]